MRGLPISIIGMLVGLLAMASPAGAQIAEVKTRCSADGVTWAPCPPGGGGGGSNAAAASTGAAPPSSASYTGFLSGPNLVGVSAANPLPITGSISATNPSVSATGFTAPGSATELGFISSGNLVGVSAASALPVTVINFPGSQAVTGTFFQATQPVSEVSLPLPAGASTSALQTAEQSPVAPSTATATQSVLNGCLAYSTLPTFTAGQQGAMPCDLTGRPYVNDGLGITPGAATATQPGPLGQAAVLSGSGSYTTGTINPLTMTVGGALRTQLYTAGTNVAVNNNSAGAAGGTHVAIGAVYNSTPLVLTSGQEVSAPADTTGAQIVDTEVQKSTYVASANTTLASAATDVLVMCGAGGKEIRIRQISLQGTATTAGAQIIALIKRSTIDSGGTSGTITSVSNDSANGVSSGTIASYTTNPASLGTALGTLLSATLQFPLAANEAPPTAFQFGASHGDQSIVLRSTTECLAVNLAGATITSGAILTTNIEFTVN